MKKNEKAGEKASLREVWTYNLRTLKLGQKIVPGLLFYLLGTALFGDRPKWQPQRLADDSGDQVFTRD